MKYLHFQIKLLKNHLAFLKDQNEITSQLLMIIKEAAAIRNNKKPRFFNFNKIINFFKEFLLCKK